jgi:metal-responsive CopG/Arc/MetJ family transcriptional regulator
MALARTTISIEKTTLDRFFRAYPAGKRSQVIQRLIQQDLESQHDKLSRAAQEVETYADFQTVREDGDLWERATASDGLDTF